MGRASFQISGSPRVSSVWAVHNFFKFQVTIAILHHHYRDNNKSAKMAMRRMKAMKAKKAMKSMKKMRSMKKKK